MIRRPPRSTQGVSSAASDVYKRQAEDSHDIILRCYEAWGREGYVCLNLDHLGRKLKFHIKPYEIKTFLIPLKPEEEVRECNLLERHCESFIYLLSTLFEW